MALQFIIVPNIMHMTVDDRIRLAMYSSSDSIALCCIRLLQTVTATTAQMHKNKPR